MKKNYAGTWLLMLLPNNSKGNEAGSSGSSGNGAGSNGNNNAALRSWESAGMNTVIDMLSVAAGNTAKDKRAKEASNRSQARGPVIRKTRVINPGKFNT